jgi:eukaryotic-like serine/threonine-protein kinase
MDAGVGMGDDRKRATLTGATYDIDLGAEKPLTVADLAEILPERYSLRHRLGEGGYGEVFRARDRLLDRMVAIKVLRSNLTAHPSVRLRFLAEARVTARLSHPGIVAVHDRGTLGDGRLWFAMKEVRGRTLDEVIRDLHRVSRGGQWRETRDGWTFRRCVEALARAAEAVAYAHSQSIVHRDLKPANLMVGEFGEVLVMDWGLARILGESDLPHSVAEEELEGEEGQPLRTRAGRILGTPAYMSPEQARGAVDEVGPAADVYGLGAILFTLLSGRPPFQGDPRSILHQVVGSAPPRVESVLPRVHPPVPEALARLTEMSCFANPKERPADAGFFAGRLRVWLDGSEKRSRAMELVREARVQRPAVAARRDQAAQLRAAARTLLDGVQSYDSMDRKAPAWALEDRADELDLDAARSEAAFLQTARAALNLVPELPEALELLADQAVQGLTLAEARGDVTAAAQYEAELRGHDRGRHAAFLQGDGAVTLVTDPPGATVEALRYVTRQRRLHLDSIGVLGRTPLRKMVLPRGSYIMVIRAPNRAPVRYPVSIGRLEHWDGIAPGGVEPAPIALPALGDVRAGAVYVPQGWFRAGGDPRAVDSFAARRVWVDGFWMEQHPVTNVQWLVFLNALVERGEGVEGLVPTTVGGTVGGGVQRPAWSVGSNGRFVLPDHSTEPQVPWTADTPVVMVTHIAACRYAAWKAARERRPWRLADELEWEKAARGVDGRAFPWGDRSDGTWACTSDSHGEQASVASVDAFPADVSPYEVAGLGGNSKDWCENGWSQQRPDVPDGGRLVVSGRGEGELRMVRGGSWADVAEDARSAGRRVGRPEIAYMRVGLRLVSDE